MKRIHGLGSILSLAVLAIGCATTSAPVPVEGTASNVAALAGHWEGTYESEATGRTGSIVFDLVAGEDHAHGDVVMIPRGSTNPYGPAPRLTGEGAGPAATAELLSIRFVRAEGETVNGTLDPYWDPDCSCEVTTTFVGAVFGDRIAGTFTSMRTAGRVSGTWKATRRPSAIR
ncbi:MAG TPA: hypothetical protein VFF17_04060 [Thermoanaerobaculia bacterium]|nr:hypothetical protein [Thermoanaerobaculia bacterium]